MNHYENLKRIRDNIVKGQLDPNDAEDINLMLDLMDRVPIQFIIDDKMCLALQHYFLTDAGYVSHEFHPDVHKFMKQLDEHIKTHVIKERNT